MDSATDSAYGPLIGKSLPKSGCSLTGLYRRKSFRTKRKVCIMSNNKKGKITQKNLNTTTYRERLLSSSGLREWSWPIRSLRLKRALQSSVTTLQRQRTRFTATGTAQVALERQGTPGNLALEYLYSANREHGSSDCLRGRYKIHHD